MKNRLLFFLFLLMGLGAAAQMRSVSGTVTDGANGGPLEGVAVVGKGTTIGVYTDGEGRYSINLPKEIESLTFNYVGYAVLDVLVGNQSVINVTMTELQVMDEIIITGYGAQIKRELTGNIAKVSGADINSIPVPSFEQALQGRAAGVFIEAANGKPGGAVKVRVRGTSSVSASSQPLYVVDGMIITASSQADPSDAPMNPLADINPQDIQSVEILKDASASAIYGARGANGVIIITTKRGQAGNTQFNVDMQTGFSRPTGEREFLNSEEFIQLFQRAAVGAGRYDFANDISGYTSEQEAIDDNVAFVESRFRRYDGHLPWDDAGQRANTDWQRLGFRDGANARMNQINVSASGGSTKTRFYMSGNYNKQEGILVGNSQERMSGRLNLDHEANDRLSFGLKMSVSRVFNDRVADDNEFTTIMQIVALAPITPPRNPDGRLYDRPVTTYYNPLVEDEDASYHTKAFRNLSTGYLEYKLFSGLKWRSELSADIFTVNDDRYWGSRTLLGLATNGQGSSRWSQTTNVLTSHYLNFEKTFAEQHNLNLTGGMEFQKSRTDITSVSGQSFPLDLLKTLASAAEITGGSSSYTEFSFLSYFARAYYNYNRKYFLTLSGRYDASSRFGANNRWGFFPSASAGWIISEESFLQGSSAISFLKLRASIGTTGNAEIGNFAALGLYGPAPYAGNSTLQPTQIPNPDLGWEKTVQFDAGIDFGLINDRLSGELDVYVKNTSDLLLNVPVPATTGFRTQLQNLGSMRNQGVEFVLNSNNLVGKFKWNTSFNIALNRNEVLSLGNDTIIDNGGSRYMNVVKVGHPIGAFYGAAYAGADPANGDALFYINGEGSGTTNNYNDANFVILGNSIPTTLAGLSNTFSYSGLELTVFFQGAFGQQIHNAAGGFMSCNACWFDNQTRDQMNYWDKPGDVTSVPEPRLGFSNGDQSRSGRYLSPGSFVRLRTATLSYTLPSSWMEKINIRSARIYATGQNLLTFTKYDGWDPEVTSDFLIGAGNGQSANVNNSTDFYSAPQPRTILFGISLGL